MKARFLSYSIFSTLTISSLAYAGQVHKWGDVDAGRRHVAAIDPQGNLYVWGDNTYKSLSKALPDKVDTPWLLSDAGNWRLVEAGRQETLMINDSGELFRVVRELDNPEEIEKIQAKDSNDQNIDLQWQRVSSNYYATFAITSNGELYGFGNNIKQIINKHEGEDPVTYYDSPFLFDDVTGETWLDAQASQQTAIALTTSGKIYTWGENKDFVLGLPNYEQRYYDPEVVPHPDGLLWKAISATEYGVLAVDENGVLWGWGNLLYTNKFITPNKVTYTDGSDIIIDVSGDYDQIKSRLATSESNSGVINSDGHVYIWGENNNDFVADSNDLTIKEPTRVESADGTALIATRLELGDGYLVITDSLGNTKTHGYNRYGQLGTDTSFLTNNSTVTNPINGFHWVDVATGSQHTLALRALETCYPAADLANFHGLSNNELCPENLAKPIYFGQLWGTGNNTKQQLTAVIADPDQDTPYIDKLSPLLNASDRSIKSDWVSVESNYNHSFAIDISGDLYAWGDNASGQLGTGDTNSRSTFTKITDESGAQTKWRSVSTNANHSLAIAEDGTLWAWGNGAHFKLGTGDNQAYLYPVQISTDTDWESVEAGLTHSTAVKSNGDRYAWGNESSGALGNGVSTDTRVTVPTLVSSNNPWTKVVSSNTKKTIGLTSSDLYVWGLEAATNYNAAEDSYTITDASSPVKFPVVQGVEDINAAAPFSNVESGAFASFAIDSQDQLWGWGSGDYGELGIGSLSYYKTMPEIVNSDQHWRQVSAGNNHVVAITQFGQIFTWGSNASGQLGVETPSYAMYETSPTAIKTYDYDGDDTPDYLDPYPQDGRYTGDYDGDGVPDEIDTDNDNDGLDDDVEQRLGLDPNNPNDSEVDLDQDGIDAKTEYANGTCEFGHDALCDIGLSTPEAHHALYANNVIYKGYAPVVDPSDSSKLILPDVSTYFDATALNKFFVSFENSPFNVAALPNWLQLDTANLNELAGDINNHVLTGIKAGTVGYESVASEAESYDGSASAGLGDSRFAITLNRMFGDDWGSYVRKLTPGNITFAYKTSSAFEDGVDSLELIAIPYEGSGLPTLPLWSTDAATDGWVRTTVQSNINNYYQLTWLLKSPNCSSSCGNKVFIDSITIPMVRDKDGIPFSYRSIISGSNNFDGDPDSDGLTNQQEYALGTNPNSSDSDSDGISDSNELLIHGTDPTNSDTDGDGISDKAELDAGLNPLVANNGDTDGDDISDKDEVDNGLNPLIANQGDSDDDGLSDVDEVNTFKTNPLIADTDQDGIDDGLEVTNNLNPLVSNVGVDTDGDGINDGDEVNIYQTSPINIDTDGDGILDNVEIQYGLNPTIPNNGDTDGDGVADKFELNNGTDPLVNTDRDRDALPDDYEVYLGVENLPLHQLWEDTDGDALPLALEKILRTNESQQDNNSYQYLDDQTYTDMLTRMALAHVRGTLQISRANLAALQSELGITPQTPAYKIYTKLASHDDLLDLSFIGRAYKAAFARDADYRGIVVWRSILNGGLSDVEVMSRFVATPVFQNKYASLGDKEFVETVYFDLFNRQPPQRGLELWTESLSKPNYTRAHLMVTLVNSQEYMNKHSTEQLLKGLYLAMTGDALDTSRLARQEAIFGDETYPIESIMRDNLMAFNFFKAMSPQTGVALLDADADSLPLRAEFTDGFDITTMDNPVNTDTVALVRQISRELNDELWSIHDTNTWAMQIDMDSTDNTLQAYISTLLGAEGFSQRKWLARVFRATLNTEINNAMYQVYLGKLLEGDLTLVNITDRFIKSAAFSIRFGSNLSDEDFVAVIYNNTFGAPISESDKATWADKLNGGMSRAEFVVELTSSVESKDVNLDSDMLTILHLGLLRNKANGVAVNDFETRVSGLSGDAYNDAVAAYAVELIRSTEFINRF